MARILCAFIAALFGIHAIAEIYKWTDSEGKTHFSDKKPQNAKVENIHPQINSYTHVTYELPSANELPAQEKKIKNVVMYSTSWCGYCKKARAYFEQNGIAYRDYDIEQSADAKQNYDAIGGRGVPIIFVGQARMNGFSSETFEYLYRQ